MNTTFNQVTNKDLIYKKYLSINEEVADTMAMGGAVVALESTIISHGMPFPKNFEMAQSVEKIVRDAGAVPATIALIGGKMKVGLTASEIEQLASAGQGVNKVSRRDLPMLLVRKEIGATTVASTMIVAALAGLKIFATGGIGGVHRGGENTFDISADLQELARTSIAVVCAGAKSILDIGLTLEYLETHGIPVVGYKTGDFPAFFTQKSGFKVDYDCQTVQEIASMLALKWSIPTLAGGVVIANPVPEMYQMPPQKINAVIEKALRRANEQGIKGKAITPYLLAAIDKMTEGASLVTNIHLVKNNALVAADIAVKLSKLEAAQ